MVNPTELYLKTAFETHQSLHGLMPVTLSTARKAFQVITSS